MTSTPTESHFHNFDIEEDSIFGDGREPYKIEVISVSQAQTELWNRKGERHCNRNF